MSHQWMRANLSSAKYPFATRLQGRTVIVPQYDENFDRTLASAAADADKDKGVPQAFYMHNVLPTQEGYQSIGYRQAVQAMTVPQTDFDSAFPIQTPNLGKFIFVPAQGKNYVLDNTTGGWSSVSPISGSFDGNTIITSAFIRAQTYLFYQNYGCLIYNPATRTMDPVALAGLVSSAIKGICAANGYMIAWDDTSVVWSSTVTETDFNASLVTGAGGGQVQDAKGKIIACLPIAGGFMVYCEKNVVAAKYSGNIRFPFTFVEVPGSGGITSPEQVSWQSNLAEHYAWTTNGFQQLDKSKSTNLLPEVTDFIAAKIFDDFDETTLKFSYQELSAQLAVKVTAVGARYIIVSLAVNAPTYTHAIVYDSILKRYGRLKITHRDCFQWNAPNLFGALTYHNLATITYASLITTTYLDLLLSITTPEAPKETFAFLQLDGTIQLVDFELALPNANGVLILGKFQFMRNQFIDHLTSDIETVKSDSNFNFYLLTTIDGKDFEDPIPCFLAKKKPLMRRYMKGVSKQNFSALLIGAFAASSYLTDFMSGGEE